jgi:hypothetical protein
MTDSQRASRLALARRLAAPVLALVAAALLLLVVRTCAPAYRLLAPAAPLTTISHSLAVERVEAVARLVTSEATVRDVVIYENTRFGSTKRALVVVTGKILAGFDLAEGANVRIDDATRTLHVTLPRARVLGVEITELRTYDERSGLLNRFQPADRDTIFQLAREQLARSALQSGALEHANRSARELLRTLFAPEGYTAEVDISVMPLTPQR